jgi:hypothetical protein
LSEASLAGPAWFHAILGAGGTAAGFFAYFFDLEQKSKSHPRLERGRKRKKNNAYSLAQSLFFKLIKKRKFDPSLSVSQRS